MQLCKQSARNGKKQSRQDKSAGGRNGKTDLGKGNREAIAAGQINALAMRRKPVSAETRRQRRRKPQTHPFFVGRAGVARSEKGDKKQKKGSDSCRSLFFAFAGAKVVFPIVPPSGGAVSARAGFPSRRSGKIKRRPYPRTPLFFSFHGFYDSSLPSAIPKSYPR